MDLEFQCCFCGEGIGDSPVRLHALDPCAVIVVANWSRDSSQQVEQQYFCHLECFRGAVQKHAPVDLEELAAELV